MDFLKDIDGSTLATLVTAAITVLLAVYLNYKSQEKIKEREREEAHRKKKIEMYSDFLDLVSRMFAAVNPEIEADEVSPDEMVEFILRFKKSILLWGSPKVIKAQLEYEKGSVLAMERKDNKKLLLLVDRLYRAMREDIGLKNKGLKKGDLIRLSLKNHDEI